MGGGNSSMPLGAPSMGRSEAEVVNLMMYVHVLSLSLLHCCPFKQQNNNCL